MWANGVKKSHGFSNVLHLGVILQITLVQFRYTCFWTPFEVSAAPISACLRRGPRGHCRSEWCTGDESMAAPRVNLSLHSPINIEHEAGQDAGMVVHVLGMIRPGIEPFVGACSIYFENT